MNKKLVVACTIVAFLGFACSAPPDPLTQYIYGFMGCLMSACVLLFVLSRDVVKESKPAIRNIVGWLITFCIVAISLAVSYGVTLHRVIKAS